MLFWVGWRWRELAARRLLLGAVLTLAVMEVGAELMLPGWPAQFLSAIRLYTEVNGNESLLTALISEQLVALPLAAVVIGLAAYFVWQARDADWASDVLLHAICVVLVATSLVTPSYALYNQPLLVLPAALFCLRHAAKVWSAPLGRTLLILLLVALGWTAALSLVFGLLYLVGIGATIADYSYLPRVIALFLPSLTLAALVVIAPHRAVLAAQAT